MLGRTLNRVSQPRAIQTITHTIEDKPTLGTIEVAGPYVELPESDTLTAVVMDLQGGASGNFRKGRKGEMSLHVQSSPELDTQIQSGDTNVYQSSGGGSGHATASQIEVSGGGKFVGASVKMTFKD